MALMPLVPVAAQTGKVDSLRQVLRQGSPTPKLLSDLAWAFVYNSPDSAVHYGKLAAKLARSLNDPGNEATAFNRIGVAFDVDNRPDSALLYYHQAVELAKRAKEPQTEAGAYNNIGLVHWNRGDHAKAVDYYLRAAAIFEQKQDEAGLANALNNIGLVLWDDKNFDRAMDYFRQSLSIRQRLGLKAGIAASYTNIGLLFEDLDRADSSIHYLLLSVPIKQELNDLYGLAKSYNNLGISYRAKGHLEESRRYYMLALECSEKVGNSRGSASTMINLTIANCRLGRIAEGVAYADSALAICELEKDAKLLWKLYAEKAKCLAGAGRHKEAFELLLLRNTIHDSLFTLERSEQLEGLQLKYETAVKDRTIMERERELAEQSLLSERRSRYILLLLVLLGITGAGWLAYGARSRAIARQERDAAIISEREAGIRAVIEATEDERRRIAKDLHDGIVQSLTGLRLRLQADGSSNSSLPLLDSSIGELREISHRMMPRALGEMGLQPAISDLLERTLAPAGIAFTFDCHRLGDERFAEATEAGIYRICQELLNNIIKHSGASAVAVQLIRAPGHLVLMAEDDGRGFDFAKAKQAGGIGLLNIISRAEALGGEAHFAPGPEKGTLVTVRIPVG